jgi:serine/threonine protein phosphatase 1
VVGEGSDRYNVVHAELTRPSQSNALPEVWTDWEIDELGPFGTAADDCPAFRWSREFMAGGRSTKFLPKTADGLSLTFCGHTVATQIRRLLSHVCIDTGAFLTLRKDTPTDQYGLTLVEAKERRWTLVRGLRTLEGDL